MADDAAGYGVPVRTESGSAVRVKRPLDTPEKVKQIEAVIAELRPTFQADGGDCELVKVEADRVLVRMTGACVGCQLAGATVQGLQARLMKELNQLVRVIPVPPGYEP
jgi:NifU-like protein